MFNSEIMSLVNSNDSLEVVYASDSELRIKKRDSQYVWIIYASESSEYVALRYNESLGCDNTDNLKMVGRLYEVDIATAMILTYERGID